MKKILSLLLTATLVLSLAACGEKSANISGEVTLQAQAAAPMVLSATIPKPFTDIPADADYAQAVDWCYENELMQGVSETRFDPNGTLTRAMVATIIHRVEGKPAATGNAGFIDVEPNSWYSAAVAWANEKGIVQGYGNRMFGTNDPVSVEQLEVILGRYIGNGVQWVGDPAKAHAATRAQVAVAVYDALAKENEGDTTSGGKVLVAYFSATGSTGRVAGYIAQAMGADLFELEPVNPYTSADLNYSNSSSRVSREHDDPSLQDIELVKTTPDNWEDYDVVFIGYPIWWHAASWVMNHFVTDNDFSGKTVIPFCTSASSPLEGSDEKLAALTDTGDWCPGQRFSGGASQSTVENWVEGLELPKVEPALAEESKTLIAYFSMPDNVDDSTVTINGEVLGNNQYFARVIQEVTGGDVFRIEAATPYPTDHATLVDQASKEQSENARPAIKDTIDNLDDYDTVFIGYPIWWSDMPQIMYTFFDQYDFSGKTVIPFNTHGGSGFAGTPATIKKLEPGATHLDGLSISRNSIENAHDQIVEWVNGLEI